MGVRKIARWFKIAARADKDRTQPSSPLVLQSSNEYYRNLVQQLANNCKTPNRDITDPDWLIYFPKEQNNERIFKKDRNRKSSNKRKQIVPGVPHIRSSEIFEIGNVAGTENRSLELISAEWHNTKVALKRHVFPACRDAIKADIEVLSEIRHPNVLLLMATTYTDEHGIVSILEPVDCTLYNYIHDQGERLNMQGIIQIGIKLADALKYCHMRGYIHGAISSHCVYFASDRNVKLGGWELARETANVYVERDYEKYLRLEIFKWQAPETFYGLHPSKKTDVYCFMLLLWEMCTGSVPWNGCDQSNEERHNSIQRRDISLNLQNIPSISPTLRDLLEIGLQSDEAKRTLDMDKISRKLHRLLMIHEEEEREATFISVHSTGANIDNSKDSLECTIYDGTFCGRTSSPSSPVRTTIFNQKPLAEQSHHTPTKENPSSRRVISKEIQCKLDSKINTEKPETSSLSIISPVKVEINPCVHCANITKLVGNIDEKSNARANIKRLKELIASRREHFFSGNKPFSRLSKGPKATSTILLSENNESNLDNESNIDYVPCKPASHKTTMEPKCNKLFVNYNGIATQKTKQVPPYTNMSESIKQAIIQPQVLHPTAESFYESALWRKEKEICISRMHRDSKEYEYLSQQSDNHVIDSDRAQCSKPHSTTINTTYNVIHDNNTENIKTDAETLLSKSVAFDLVSSNKSSDDIRTATDAVERAMSLVEQNLQNCKKQLFEDLYETKHNENENIKVIETSTSDNENFLGMSELASPENTDKASSEYTDIFNQAFIASKTFSFSSKISNESPISLSDQESKTNFQEMKNGIFSLNKKPIPQRDQIDFERNKKRYINVGSTTKNIVIKDEIRRRSLPARLNNVPVPFNLENRNNTDGSQFTLKNNDGTCYIDDDYKRRSQLNCNLMLFDDYIDLSETIGTIGDSESQTTEL
ncbi:uncharacterized protein LOC109851792 isoform X2 [Pseudomyrmex gracilis]|uniref:uncharacterized protein LOC109851792 isoform X2 n=1 Tax=Pseudomyrmex gracilis TaxID=219809 RepID=UPI000994AA2E|nr:uncharacterized protein LOC109851792 isoform X2 [Pseudomyrmex gracilis]